MAAALPGSVGFGSGQSPVGNTSGLPVSMGNTTPAGAANVNSPSTAWLSMCAHWQLPRTLMGGTMQMRLMGRLYLPQEQGEPYQAYYNRLNRSVLFPGFRKTVEALSAKPFQTPVVLDDGTPDNVAALAKDIDLTGRDLTTFSRDLFQDAIIDGIAYILVDYPVVPQGISAADEQAGGYRPYFVQLAAADVIEAKVERIAGADVLTRVRIRQNTLEEDGLYGEKVVSRVRVLMPDRWEIWVEDDTESARETGGYILEASGPNTLGHIPLVPVYTGRTAPFQALPPLEDLAYLNLRHWQSSSDQQNILHVARVPFLVATGVGGRGDETISIGPNTMQKFENKDAKVFYVEHTGKAIEAGQTDIETIQQQMSTLGYEPLVTKLGKTAQTATQRVVDLAESQSDIQAWARGLENALEEAFEHAAEWMGMQEAETEKISVSISSDFGLSLREQLDVDALLKIRQGGDLSRETLWAELGRRSILSDAFDPEAEQEAIDAEGPPLASLTSGTADANAKGAAAPAGAGAGLNDPNKTATPAKKGSGTPASDEGKKADKGGT